jgi:carboxyl-terminal processing protease
VFRKLFVLLVLFFAAGSLAVLALRSSGSNVTSYSMVGAPLSLLSGSSSDDDYSLSLLRYFRIAATKVTTDYVDPARVEPVAMLRGALDQVARDVPEFLYDLDVQAGTLELVVGLDSHELPLPDLDGVPDLASLMTGVAGFLDEHLAQGVPRKEIEYAMMNGMLKTLDPHSFFINPESFEEMQVNNDGHFGGLGITIGIREGRLTILYPLADTPAWRSGLKAGDHIDKIGRESTVNMELNEAVRRLRGVEGTQVTITVSDDEGLEREVTLTRARIDVPTVKFAYAGDGVGYVQVLHFAKQTYDNLDEALDDLDTSAIADGHGHLQGLVIDLRGNPGGYLEQAVLMADKFIRTGVIVTTEGMAGTAREPRAARRFGTEDDLPIVVLVDSGSASASEIVAGALQNQDRALVMGTRTFGKGSVQNLYERNFDNGALKLTTARYLTPGDLSIQGVGIQPDVELRPAFTEREDDGELDIRMFWDDFELREEDLDGSFVWGDEQGEDKRPRYVFSCTECWDDPTDRQREETAADALGLPQVQAAKAILVASGSTDRGQLLSTAREILPGVFAGRESELGEWMAGNGIDWSRAPVGLSSDTRLKVELKVQSEDGSLAPGADTDITLAVTNEGSEPLHRFRAVTSGEFFRGREYFFGRLLPGETREYTVTARPRLWLNARTERVDWHFFADGAVKLPTAFIGRLKIKEALRPRFAYSWAVVDDGTGTSKGNGDGLVQAGETLDLLVTVRNIGDGPTSDIWRAERGLLGASEDKDGDGVSDRQAGFVRFKNRSGASVFLEEGSASFTLAIGEEVQRRLRFRVAEDAAGLETIEGQLMVGDERFLEVLSSDVELPLFAASGTIVEDDRVVAPKKPGQVFSRSGASDLMPLVGRFDGPVASTGRLGDWVRVSLPWGGDGWVRSDEVSSAPRDTPPLPITAHLPNSPPVISLASNPGGTVVTDETLRLTGAAVDDEAVQDLFVFVNDRKVSFERLATPVSSHAFEFDVKLQPGVNDIEIFSRDSKLLQGSLALGVYRETATAAATSRERPVVR